MHSQPRVFCWNTKTTKQLTAGHLCDTSSERKWHWAQPDFSLCSLVEEGKRTETRTHFSLREFNIASKLSGMAGKISIKTLERTTNDEIVWLPLFLQHGAWTLCPLWVFWMCQTIQQVGSRMTSATKHPVSHQEQHPWHNHKNKNVFCWGLSVSDLQQWTEWGAPLQHIKSNCLQECLPPCTHLWHSINFAVVYSSRIKHHARRSSAN